MVDSSRQAWVDAVAAGETTDSFVDWRAASEREALADDDDGPEMIEFSFRIGVTTRAFYEIEFEAESLEKAREHAATINPAEYLAHFPEGIEGDQIGYLRQSDDSPVTISKSIFATKVNPSRGKPVQLSKSSPRSPAKIYPAMASAR